MMPDPKDGKALVGHHSYPGLTRDLRDDIEENGGDALHVTVVDSPRLARDIDENLDLARLKGIAQLRNSLLALRAIHRAQGREDHANALQAAVGVANAMLGRSVSDHQIDETPGSMAIATQAAADSAEPQSNPLIVRAPV